MSTWWRRSRSLYDTHVQQVQDDVLLHGKQRDAKQGDHQQLHWTHFAEQSPVGDERAGAAEISVDETNEEEEENIY